MKLRQLQEHGSIEFELSTNTLVDRDQMDTSCSGSLWYESEETFRHLILTWNVTDSSEQFIINHIIKSLAKGNISPVKWIIFHLIPEEKLFQISGPITLNYKPIHMELSNYQMKALKLIKWFLTRILYHLLIRLTFINRENWLQKWTETWPQTNHYIYFTLVTELMDRSAESLTMSKWKKLKIEIGYRVAEIMIDS